jgi:hypothetical protein
MAACEIAITVRNEGHEFAHGTQGLQPVVSDSLAEWPGVERWLSIQKWKLMLRLSAPVLVKCRRDFAEEPLTHRRGTGRSGAAENETSALIPLNLHLASAKNAVTYRTDALVIERIPRSLIVGRS